MSKLILTSFLAALAPTAALAEDELGAKQIVDKALDESSLGAGSGQATVKMRIQTPRGDILERSLFSRSDSKGGIRRVRITFMEPEDQRGIEVLMLQGPGGDDQQYLYLPRYKKTRRITGSAKHGKFEGSDFTYADLENRSLKDAKYTKQKDENFGGQDCYRVDLEPAAEDRQYAKVELWVSKATWVPVRVAFYDLHGKLQKELKVKRLKKIKGNYVATGVSMKNLQTGSETSMEVSDIQSEVQFPDSVFNVSSLGQ